MAILAQFKSVGVFNTKERLHIKAFKTEQEANEFLNKQYDNNWKLIKEGQLTYLRVPYPSKSGVYLAAGSQWLNVRKCDAMTLAHC